ncbi:MAG: hypothetical protein JWN67_5329 [Actinomycetia bacterium]|nr:hypothetical protein [Actinomycetes bacterium]
MSIRLNDQQTADWVDAVQSVEEIAANTDSHSTSKPFIDTMARFIRDEPHMVVRLLTLV